MNEEEREDGVLEPGTEQLRDLPRYLNGSAKAWGFTAAFLWSCLIGLLGYVVGGTAQAQALERHTEAAQRVLTEVPILKQRVDGLQERILDRLSAIETQLGRLEDRGRGGS